MVKKIICIIPARSGSKRIKNKNTVKIKSTSLINYICSKVKNSKLVENFYIATDSKKIFHSIQNKKKFIFYKRSKKSASANSKTEEVILEFLKNNKDLPDIIIIIQLTNPFINSKILDNAIKKFLKNRYDCLLSVSETNKFLWYKKKFTNSINYNYKKRPMTQNFNSYLVENGSFYIFNRKSFMKFKNRLHRKIGYYIMPKISQFEIDDREDLKIIKKLI